MMKPNEALEVLVKAANVAQSKGAFNLSEAKVVAEAIESFTAKTPDNKSSVDESAPLPAAPDESVQNEAAA